MTRAMTDGTGPAPGADATAVVAAFDALAAAVLEVAEALAARAKAQHAWNAANERCDGAEYRRDVARRSLDDLARERAGVTVHGERRPGTPGRGEGGAGGAEGPA